MHKSPHFLFVYGTLLTTDNKFGLYLKNNCRHHKKGTFKGKLYDIGHYPGTIASTGENDKVHGSIWELNNPDEVLKVLDPYEGISAEMPQPHEYTRDLVDIETDEGTILSWIYLYNWPVDENKLIPSGDYLAYMKLR